MKKLSFIIILFVGIITSSCLDIVEDIKLNTDGSGTYSMVMDMSELMSMMQGFMESDDSGAPEAFGAMDSSLQAMTNALRELDGISNVAHQSENFKFKISYDFENVEALNIAVKNNALSPAGGLGQDDMMGGIVPSSPGYEWTSKSFERIDPPMDDVLGTLAGDDDEMAQSLEMAKMMMGSASFKSVYHFPGKVKSVENEDATLSSDKKDRYFGCEIIGLNGRQCWIK